MLKGLLLATFINGDTVGITPNTDMYCSTQESIVGIVDTWRKDGYQAANSQFHEDDSCNIFPAQAMARIIKTISEDRLEGADREMYVVKVLEVESMVNPSAPHLFFMIGTDTKQKVSQI